MRSFIRQVALLSAVFVVVPSAWGKEATAVGQKIPAQSLVDSTGKTWELGAIPGRRATILVFIGTACPVANLYLPELSIMQDSLESKGVQIFGVNANAGDSKEAIAEHASEFKVGFPVLIDAKQELADAIGAKRTPEVFVADETGTIRYHGRIDDRYGYVYRRDSSTRADLAEAVNELLEGKKVSLAETEAIGCLIDRRESATAASEVTYAKDVSRILRNKCGFCHREGSAGPFELETFDDATKWADTIKEVVSDGRMPPWHADAPVGHFSNDRRLTDTEKRILFAWIDGGQPMGSPEDLPVAAKHDDTGWMIGEPDLVLKLPEKVTIQADGVVPYQYYRTPTNFKEDMWITAAEARPGNRRVVHHIIVFFRDPETKLPIGEPDGKKFGFLVGTAPGDMPLILPDGVARRVPAGAELVWQMHYTPTGKEEEDQSEIGLIFHKGPEPPKYNAITKGISQRWFKIPAGADNHKVESTFVFKEDSTLLSFMPHMHLRGKSFSYEAIYPDGKHEMLLDIPKYDFNWQSTYRLARPKLMPKGTTIHCVAHYDNSTANPANPDPTKNVFWGDQTWEEMMIGWIDYMNAEPIDPQVAGTK